MHVFNSLLGRSMQHALCLRISLYDHLMSDSSRNTSLTKRLLQRNLGREAGTMHRQHIHRCRPQLIRQVVDSGRDPINELRACEMQPANDLSNHRSQLARFQEGLSVEACHVYRTREPLDGVFDDIDYARV